MSKITVSSLISVSESIVDLIDRCVQAEESHLAKMASSGTQTHTGSVKTGGGHPDGVPSGTSSEAKAASGESGSDSFPSGGIQSDVRLMGTDIDHDAGSVDWSAVKSTGTSWVYCKVSGGFSNTSYSFQDPGFADYWPQLEQAQIARGAYCFFDLSADGKTQAQLYLQLLDAAGGMKSEDLPPCLDVEWTPSPSDTPFPADNQWQDEALAWLNYVEEQTGRIPVIYTGLRMAQNHFDSRFSRYPLWVARYPTEDPITPTKNPYPSYAPQDLGPWKDWMIWQYSENGTISGIGPGQDLDVLVGTVEEFVKATTVGEESAGTEKHARSTHDNTQPDHSSAGSGSPSAEQKTYMETVGNVSVYKTSPFPAVIYQSGLAVDADGSPFAYHPEPDSDKGLDYLVNAGSPGDWWGIATENGQSSGTPVIQGANDPAPGYYVSTTSLEDPNYSSTDPRAYVNASEIPFIVLPLGHDNFGGAMGDMGAVVNLSNGDVSYVIAADAGPDNQLGEGSVALAKALGVNSSPKDGGASSGIAYCFFPGSGNGRPQTLENINKIGAKLFAEFGGVDRLKELLDGA